MYYTYILRGEKNYTYVGSSSNLKSRLEQHNKGQVNSTCKHTPLKLIWYAGFQTRNLAESFEKYLKSSSGHAFRNKRLIG
tara:strand:- start:306 stop:545 length:240 start_codon:yes stop_codon:yes gene_type:complete